MAVINRGYREYKLDNGLVVALQETPTQTVSAKLRVNYGSSHEMQGEEGMAHFLEHCLMSGGSRKYSPKTVDRIRSNFGYSNAFTTVGRTFFAAQMLREDLETWVDYVSNIVLEPRFDGERINAERQRVLREISDAKSVEGYELNKRVMDLLFRGHPKSINSLGKEEIIKSADLEKIRTVYSRGYHPNNMDLIIVGALPKNIEEIIKGFFGNKPAGENTRREFPKLEPLKDRFILHESSGDVNAENPEESSARVFLYSLGPANESKEEFAVRAMSQILGGDSNSLLFKDLSLRRGLAYSVSTSYNGNYNVGDLRIETSVPVRRLEESLDCIFAQIEKMKTKRVNDETVGRLKKIVKYSIAKTYESNEGHTNAIESKLDFGLTPEALMSRIEQVTPEKVQEVSRKYLPDRNKGDYILLIVNPLHKK